MTLLYTLTWTLDGIDDSKSYKDHKTALKAQGWLEKMNAVNIAMSVKINTPDFDQEAIDKA